MGWKSEDLDKYLLRPEILHSEYPTEKRIWDIMVKIARYLRKAYIF
jgi:hypothetical protein